MRRKPSRSMAYQLGKVNKNYDEILSAVTNDNAILVKRELWNKTQYAIQYKEGGYSLISKRVYDKIQKN